MKKHNSTLAALVTLGLLSSAAATAGSWQQNVAIGGFNKVHLYTPDSVSAIGQGRGLLVVLHGCTQSVDAYLTANLAQAASAAPDSDSGEPSWPAT